jgi:FixJ family two-component response regulator
MVLDVRLPGKSGLDLQDELAKANIRRPIIFISGHADVAMSVRAMKAGAVEFLTKPVRDQDLLDAVQLAIEQDRAVRRDEADIAELRENYATLTGRERDIMDRVVMGRRNKQIAADVGVTEATVKLHRSHIMQKMHAQSLVELLRMNDALRNKPRGSQTKV